MLSFPFPGKSISQAHDQIYINSACRRAVRALYCRLPASFAVWSDSAWAGIQCAIQLASLAVLSVRPKLKLPNIHRACTSPLPMLIMHKSSTMRLPARHNKNAAPNPIRWKRHLCTHNRACPLGTRPASLAYETRQELARALILGRCEQLLR